jgi:hypothetical protein
MAGGFGHDDQTNRSTVHASDDDITGGSFDMHESREASNFAAAADARCFDDSPPGVRFTTDCEMRCGGR